MAVQLPAIIDSANLKQVWRDLRKLERKPHIHHAPLIRSSTGGSAFEFDLDHQINTLRRDLKDGSYRPIAPTSVDGSKSVLLRRRFTSLAQRDALIYRAVSEASASSLLKSTAKWAFLGRSAPSTRRGHSKKTHMGMLSEGWFEAFMRQRGLWDNIVGDSNDYVLISDVTNFFPSIDLARLRSRVDASSHLDRDSLDVMFHLLDASRQRDDLAPNAPIGLPVVEDDSSRILAHFFLTELDESLSDLGKLGRYTRWVDDVVLSVSGIEEASEVSSRIQSTLARLGLVPNSSKTRMISKAVFRAEHLESENYYLTGLQEKATSKTPVTSSELHNFEKMSKSFMQIKRKYRAGGWSRVARRMFSTGRMLESNSLKRVWPKYLREFPGESQQVMDYLAFRKWTFADVQSLFEYLERTGYLYEDVMITSCEALMIAPMSDSKKLRAEIVTRLKKLINTDGEAAAGNPYIMGLSATLIFKFGQSRDVDHVMKTLRSIGRYEHSFVAYALPVTATRTDYFEESMSIANLSRSPQVNDVARLILAVRSGDPRAINVVSQYIGPYETQYPSRAVIPARVLPLLRLAHSSVGGWAKLSRRVSTVVNTINNSNPPDLKDRISLNYLSKLNR